MDSSPRSPIRRQDQPNGSRSNEKDCVARIVLHIIEDLDQGQPAQTLTYNRESTSVINIGRRPSSASEEDPKQELHTARFKCPVISRSHARIVFSDSGNVFLYDLYSHHGTHVLRSGELVSTPVQPEKSTQLSNGDLITFGKSVDANGKIVRPVTARVELVLAEKAPVGSPCRNSASPRAKNTSGRYGISIPLPHDDDVASTSSDDSDVEELPVRPASLYMNAWEHPQDAEMLVNCEHESFPRYMNEYMPSMPTPSLPSPSMAAPITQEPLTNSRNHILPTPEASWPPRSTIQSMPEVIYTPVSSVPLWHMPEGQGQIESRSPSPEGWSDEEDHDDVEIDAEIQGRPSFPSRFPPWTSVSCTLPPIYNVPLQASNGTGQGQQASASSIKSDNQKLDDQEQDHSSISDSESIFDRCIEDIDGLKADVDNAKRNIDKLSLSQEESKRELQVHAANTEWDKQKLEARLQVLEHTIATYQAAEGGKAGKIAELVDRVNALEQKLNDTMTSNPLVASNEELKDNVRILKELAADLEALGSLTTEQVAQEIRKFEGVRDASMNIIAEEMSTLRSLKRKRDTADDEDTLFEVSSASSPEIADGNPPARKRVRSLASTMVRTLMVASLGAAATWTSLAFS